MRAMLVWLFVLFLAAPAVAAEPPVRDDEPGWWEAHLVIDDPDAERIPLEALAEQRLTSRRTIKFLLWIPPEKHNRTAYIRNGDEFIAVQIERRGDELRIEFPHYDSIIVADRDQDGKYLGIWSKKRTESVATMRFIAKPRDEAKWRLKQRMLENWNLEAMLTSRYEFVFANSGRALGTFELPTRETASLTYEIPMTGTIETPTGDYRFLSGEFRHYCASDTIELSVFDGAHAFLFRADVDWNSPSRSDLVNGHFFSGNHWHETFTARRLEEGEEFNLPDPFSEVGLKPGVTRLGLPRLSEPPYAGKPTIVQVMGTWCPNCHDEAPALADLYEEYHDDGLQILSLCYEYTDDPERSRRQIERFKERHGASWEFVAAGVNDKQKTAATLPALTSIKSYPTTIWVNPDGTVRAIHSGFSGPATGERHTETLEEFERLTREIVEAQKD